MTGPAAGMLETGDGAKPDGDGSRLPPWIPKLILLVVLAAFASYAAFMLIRKLRDLIIWLIAALFLSFAIEPAVNALARRGWKRGLATGLIVLGVLLALAVVVALMTPLVVTQVRDLIDRAPGWLAQANAFTQRRFDVTISGKNIVDYIKNAKASIASAATTAASIGAYLLSLVFQVLTVGLFTFYMVADGPRFRRTICSVLPPRRQLEVLSTWELAIDKTGGYLYSRLLLAALNGSFTFIALAILHVPFALPLALWEGFISQFIPVVGTYLAAAVPVLVALLYDPWSAAWFVVFVLVYQQVENYVFSPRITARTMQLHPAIAFGAALAGAAISGLLGALIALPAAAVIQATISSYLTRHEVLETELTREEPLPPPSASPPPEARGRGAFGWLRRRAARDRPAG